MNRDSIIETLEGVLNENDKHKEFHIPDEVADAIDAAICILKNDCKSKDDCTQYRDKYFALDNAINTYSEEVLHYNNNHKDELTWEDAMRIFWRYFEPEN